MRPHFLHRPIGVASVAVVLLVACNGTQGSDAGDSSFDGFVSAPDARSDVTGDALSVDTASDVSTDLVTDASTDATGEVGCDGQGGCYACAPSTPLQFLNQCTNSQCSPFDNTTLPLLADGGLPPLP
jgi:hypothetical protein